MREAIGILCGLCGLALAAAAQPGDPGALSQPESSTEAPSDAPARETRLETGPEQDRAIERRILGIYSEIEGLDQVRVGVRSGVVTLSGEVLSQNARERALRLARQVQDVVEVVDETQVARDPERQLGPAVSALRERLADAIAYLPLVGAALVVFAVFWVLGALVGAWEAPYRLVTRNALLRDLLRQLARTAVLLAGILIAFQILDATALLGAVLGAAGIFGLALGFALRGTIENYVSGLLLSLRQPFTHHDRVRIGEYEGAVLRMTPRATILMTLDGNHVRIPNSVIFNDVLINYTRNPERRFEFDVGIGVEESIVDAQQLAAKTLEGMQGVLRDPPPRVDVWALGESNVTLRVYGWMDQRETEYEKVRSEALRLVKGAFDSAGVSMPMPTYDVRLQRRGTRGEKPVREAGPRHAIDVARRDEIDREIAADRRAGKDGDLLQPDAPQE